MKTKLEIINLENHTFQIQSETELVSLFGEKEQRRVILPANTQFPIKAQYYYAWKESSGVYTYLVFKKPSWDKPRGLLFKRTRVTTRMAGMCDWCLSIGSSDQVGMLGLDVNSRQSIGMILCTDLGCIERLQEASVLSGKNFDKLAQGLITKIEKLYENVERSQKFEDSVESYHR
jgi:hypothetical protein